MKNQFYCLLKRPFKRAFAVVLVLCMLSALAPKNSLSARAEDTAENLSLSATVSSNAVTSEVNKLNDGDHNTAIWRSGAAADLEGKDYYQLNWTSPVSVDQVVLVATKARNQGPTAWRVQISKDGETAWTDVASVSDVMWTQLGDVKESQKLTFNYQKDIKGVRIWINKANLSYSGYGIQEIEVYNISNGNYAISADVSSNTGASGMKTLNDGDHNTAIWRSGAAAAIEGKDYYQFNWTNPVSVNELILVATKARNQGPTAWHVQVSEDGVNNWTDVASVSDIEWKELGDVKESSKLTFALQENIKGIRVWIDKANLSYGGYGIQEIEIYNDSAVTLKGYSLSLFDGEIGLNYYMSIDSELGDTSNITMHYAVDGKEQIVTATSKDGYQVFTCRVPAKNMADEISVTMYHGDTPGATYSYSVKKYAETILRDETYAKEQPLVRAMLNYGSCAQQYFSYNLEKLANGGTYLGDQVLSNVTADTFQSYASQSQLGNEDVTLYAASLILKARTALRLYFKTADSVDEATLTCKGEVLHKKGGYYYIDVKDILPQNLTSDQTVTVNYGANQSTDVTYNCMTYCYNVLNSSSTEDSMKNVVRALYLYGQAAAEYTNSTTVE